MVIESREEMRKRLEAPISRRISMYEHYFAFGFYEHPQDVQFLLSRGFKESEKQEYVLYRLKLEEYEWKELEKNRETSSEATSEN